MNAGPDSAADDCTVGIDLGTTRSVIAHLDEFSRPRTIPNGEGELATPSAVLFEDGRVIVGKEALRALASAPEHVAQFAKREMGNSKFSMMFDGTSYPPEMIQSFGRHATMIGKFVVYDLPRGLSARTPIDVLFSYDRDGIIEVEAILPSTGSKASIRIERASGLSTIERDQWRDQAQEILEALGLD